MTRLMIIGYYIYPDVIGGTEYAIYKFAQFLRKKPIHFALTIKKHQNFNVPELKDFKIYPVKGGNLRVISPPLHVLSIFINLLKFKPDIVVGFGVFEFSFAGLVYAKLFRKKLIVRSEGDDVNFLGNIFNVFLKKYLCRNAQQILCVSPSHLPVVNRFRPKTPLKLLLNGTDAPIFDPLLRNQKNFYSLLFVGRLDPIKNLKTLLKSFQLLLEQANTFSKEIFLTICGDGPEKKTLEETSRELQITEYVRFTGMLNREQLNKEYEVADIFILPSLSEGFPLVIAEALSFGCAIVCSGIPSLTYVLKENENCLFYTPPKDANELTKALSTLLLDESLRKQMQNVNLEFSKQFIWDKIWEKLFGIALQETKENNTN